MWNHEFHSAKIFAGAAFFVAICAAAIGLWFALYADRRVATRSFHRRLLRVVSEQHREALVGNSGRWDLDADLYPGKGESLPFADVTFDVRDFFRNARITNKPGTEVIQSPACCG